MAMQEVTTTEARTLAGLGRRQEALSLEERELHMALSEGSGAEKGLEVFSLGSLHAQREGELIRSWGGPKAGTRQAEAIFAFLFDRGDRGAVKDELVELIWPDIDLARADLAFHRTVGGLRRTLSASGARAGDAISFHNDRYRLNPDMVRWSDVAEFEEHLVLARTAGDAAERLVHLEAARRLYRGDYLDDCPFYGDSSDVEDRRQLLRGSYTDILLALAESHELRGDRPAAAGFFRDAVQVNGGHCQPAEDGLARLQASPAQPTPA
jgi:two-component SAPR family response regulator